MTRLRRDYFEGLYADSEDPWGFTDRWYERRKYDLTLACLPRPAYRSALEVGCSIGVLSARLAGRCEALLAVDVAAAAVTAAQDRLRDQAHVRVERHEVPEQWPEGTFDLVVLSEVAYYLDEETRGVLWDRATGCLEPGGHLLAVHWRHPVDDYPASGDEVHASLAGHASFPAPGAGAGRLARLVRHEELDVLLEVWARTPPPARSVAQEQGLA